MRKIILNLYLHRKYSSKKQNKYIKNIKGENLNEMSSYVINMLSMSQLSFISATNFIKRAAKALTILTFIEAFIYNRFFKKNLVSLQSVASAMQQQ